MKYCKNFILLASLPVVFGACNEGLGPVQRSICEREEEAKRRQPQPEQRLSKGSAGELRGSKSAVEPSARAVTNCVSSNEAEVAKCRKCNSDYDRALVVCQQNEIHNCGNLEPPLTGELYSSCVRAAETTCLKSLVFQLRTCEALSLCPQQADKNINPDEAVETTFSNHLTHVKDRKACLEKHCREYQSWIDDQVTALSLYSTCEGDEKLSMCLATLSPGSLKGKDLTMFYEIQARAIKTECKELPDNATPAQRAALDQCHTDIRCYGLVGEELITCQKGIYKRNYELECGENDTACEESNAAFDTLRGDLNDCNLPTTRAAPRQHTNKKACAALVVDPAYTKLRTQYMSLSTKWCDDNKKGDDNRDCKVPQNLFIQLEKNLLAKRQTYQQLKDRRSSAEIDPADANHPELALVFTSAEKLVMGSAEATMSAVAKCCNKITLTQKADYAKPECPVTKRSVDVDGRTLDIEKTTCQEHFAFGACKGTHAASPSCRISKCYMFCYTDNFGASLDNTVEFDFSKLDQSQKSREDCAKACRVDEFNRKVLDFELDKRVKKIRTGYDTCDAVHGQCTKKCKSVDECNRDCENTRNFCRAEVRGLKAAAVSIRIAEDNKAIDAALSYKSVLVVNAFETTTIETLLQKSKDARTAADKDQGNVDLKNAADTAEAAYQRACRSQEQENTLREHASDEAARIRTEKAALASKAAEKYKAVAKLVDGLRVEAIEEAKEKHREEQDRKALEAAHTHQHAAKTADSRRSQKIKEAEEKRLQDENRRVTAAGRISSGTLDTLADQDRRRLRDEKKAKIERDIAQMKLEAEQSVKSLAALELFESERAERAAAERSSHGTHEGALKVKGGLSRVETDQSHVKDKVLSKAEAKIAALAATRSIAVARHIQQEATAPVVQPPKDSTATFSAMAAALTASAAEKTVRTKPETAVQESIAVNALAETVSGSLRRVRGTGVAHTVGIVNPKKAGFGEEAERIAREARLRSEEQQREEEEKLSLAEATARKLREEQQARLLAQLGGRGPLKVAKLKSEKDG